MVTERTTYLKITRAHLETLDLDDEEKPEKDKPLGRDYEREAGHDAHDTEREADPSLYTRSGEVDVSENSRNHDYESTPGRVRIGGEGELDISRVDVDSTGRTQGSCRHMGGQRSAANPWIRV